jgi:hypothetical protein
MRTDKLTECAEKMLSDFDNAAKELIPHIEDMLAKIDSKREAFKTKKKIINKDIERGARTTRHRLHF